MKNAIFILLVLMLVLASCSNNGPVGPSNDKTFLGGTEGLKIEFLESEPPAEVTDGGTTPFTVTMKLENKGETEVAKENVYLKLRGIHAPSFGLDSSSDLIITSISEDVLANEIIPDTGGAITPPPAYVTFPMMTFTDTLSGNEPFPFFVDVCYLYQTKATTQLCIKENLLDSTDTDVCAVLGRKKVENSGAPVQITEFEEFTRGIDKVSFTLTLKNLGGGLISKTGVTCNETPLYDGVVTLTVNSGLTGLECVGLDSTTGTAVSGDVKVSTVTNEKKVTCTQNLPTREDKIKIVDLKLDYDYKDTVSTSVLVKHI